MDPNLTDDEWYAAVADDACNAIEVGPPCMLEWRFFPAEDRGLGIDLIEICPLTEELREAGPNDGAEVYGLISHIDILQVQQDCFDECLYTALGGDGALTFEGKADGREFSIRICPNPPAGGAGG